MLTRKKIWRKISRAFDAYANGAPETEIVRWGLCNAVEQNSYMGNAGRYHPEYRPNGYGPAFPKPYWWPLSRRGAACRAVYAQLMAEVGV
jgi:hypothetical protein